MQTESARRLWGRQPRAAKPHKSTSRTDYSRLSPGSPTTIYGGLQDLASWTYAATCSARAWSSAGKTREAARRRHQEILDQMNASPAARRAWNSAFSKEFWRLERQKGEVR